MTKNYRPLETQFERFSVISQLLCALLFFRLPALNQYFRSLLSTLPTFASRARSHANSSVRSIFVASVILLAACAQIPHLPADAPDSLRIATFQTMADRVMARGISPEGPGLAVLVKMNGRVVYEGAAGMADRIRGVRITGKTTFELASASKPLTASAVLKLVEAGSIYLDDSAKKWLPDLPNDWSEITVRDLLTHQSGIPDYMVGMAIRDAPRLLDGLTNEMLTARWRASPALLFTPGSRSQYSNSNFVLLAEIVAIASGRPFAQGDCMKQSRK